MDATLSQDEPMLRGQLREARERLDALVGDLRAVDAELDALAAERERHRLLHQVCDGLDGLRELGAAAMFWGDAGAERDGFALVRQVRGRVDAFEKQVAEIEERRQSALDEIHRQEEATEWLEDDVFELERLEEERRQEWVIERDVEGLLVRASVMPWMRGREEDQRFRANLATALAISLVLGLIFPLIDLPLPEPWEIEEVPERLTRLIRDERALPPPPPVQERLRPEERPPEPMEELVAEELAPKPSPKQTPTPAPESKGILAFREKFSSLADAPAARLGAAARIDRSGEAAVGRPQRSMVTTQAPGSSGGINLASLSRDTGGGGGGLEGVQVGRATSSIGGIAGPERPLAGGPGAGRTDEEIQIVFDRHKAALYRLYNRELRRDPTLQGQMVLRLTIEPDGSVSLCRLQSSDMNAPQLSAQVVERVRGFDFGAKEVPPVTILYPIDFLPAT